jgi:LuxR family transcriptional regulator of csgAB operon
VHGGEIWGSRCVLSQIAQRSIEHTRQIYALSKSSLKLTERESEIVRLLQDGSTNKEIAQQLCISDKTVKAHMHNIFGKLQIHRRQMILPAFPS